MTDAAGERLLERLLDRGEVGIALLDAGLRYTSVNEHMAALNGVPAERHLGRPVREVLAGTGVEDDVEQMIRGVFDTGEPVFGVVVSGSTPTTRDRHWQVTYLPLDTPAGRAVGAVVVDVTERVRATEEARRRIRQQELVADLYQRAMRDGSVEDLLDFVCVRVAEELGADRSGVMFLSEAGDELVMRAGAGWPAAATGAVTAGLGTASQAGYSLMHGGPVVLRDADAEDRFELSPALRESGIRSAISTPIPGDPTPVGVFGVLSRSPARFDDDDAGFLRSCAHVIGNALVNAEHRRRLEELAAERGRLVAQALEAGEREQRKVADMLQDEVLQHLLSARLELSADDGLDTERVRAAVTEAADIVGALAASLSPVTLEHAGLTSAVDRIAADHAARGGLTIDVAVDPAAEGVADRLLVSLARELLTNVVRHAGATRAAVAVTLQGDDVRLRVADDGRGLSEASRAGLNGDGSERFGLAYARERVEALGGSLTVREGANGTGTEITVVLPPVASR